MAFTQKQIFDTLPASKQWEAFRAWQEGCPRFLARVPVLNGEFAFDLNEIFPDEMPRMPVPDVEFKVDPSPTPFMAYARQSGKTEEMRRCVDAMRHYVDIKVGIDPAVSRDKAVMVSYDEAGRFADSVWLNADGTKGGWHPGMPNLSKPPLGKDVGSGGTGATGNWPYDLPGTWLDAEPPNNTPPGLLVRAPMDGRLGQWRPA